MLPLGPLCPSDISPASGGNPAPPFRPFPLTPALSPEGRPLQNYVIPAKAGIQGWAGCPGFPRSRGKCPKAKGAHGTTDANNTR